MKMTVENLLNACSNVYNDSVVMIYVDLVELVYNGKREMIPDKLLLRDVVSFNVDGLNMCIDMK